MAQMSIAQSLDGEFEKLTRFWKEDWRIQYKENEEGKIPFHLVRKPEFK